MKPLRLPAAWAGVLLAALGCSSPTASGLCPSGSSAQLEGRRLACEEEDGARSGPSLAWHRSGQLSEVARYRTGKPEGSVVLLRESGVPEAVRAIDPGSGRETATHYYPDGRIRIYAEWLERRLDGYYRAWYPDGQLKMEGLFERGKRNGTWTFWSEAGAVDAVVVYEKGRELQRDASGSAARTGAPPAAAAAR